VRTALTKIVSFVSADEDLLPGGSILKILFGSYAGTAGALAFIGGEMRNAPLKRIDWN
jgi:hypothetical protein